MAKLLKISKLSLDDLESCRTIPSIAHATEISKKIGLVEAVLVELSLQDQIRREKLNLVVEINTVKKKSTESILEKWLSRESSIHVWLRLGIKIEHIKPGHSEQNGRHERMYLTLKKNTFKPAAENIFQQQAKFDDFIHEYNDEHPREALQMKYPCELYTPSRPPSIS